MIPQMSLALPTVSVPSLAIFNFTSVSSRQPSPLYELLLHLTDERAESISLCSHFLALKEATHCTSDCAKFCWNPNILCFSLQKQYSFCILKPTIVHGLKQFLCNPTCIMQLPLLISVQRDLYLEFFPYWNIYFMIVDIFPLYGCAYIINN